MLKKAEEKSKGFEMMNLENAKKKITYQKKKFKI